VDFQSFDAGYLEKLAAGDPETERHFHEYFGQLILIRLRARRYSYHAIDDIRQETFLRVLRSLRAGEIREPGSLGAFVNSVCRYVMLEFHRTASRYGDSGEEMPEVRDERADTEQAVYTSERQQIVRKVLDKLSAKNRRLLSAVFLEELTTEEVCRRFGVDANYLRVLLFRARNQFRQGVGELIK
jgi:RNA polymerase sigma-70 factor, ECF subfamily